MTEKMTVHQALCETKIAEKKIIDAIKDLDVVTSNRANAVRVKGIKPEEYAENAKSSYQRVTDLIARTEAIKKAINQYNAEKHIVVGDKDYTIAEAIYMMNHGIRCKKALIDRLVIQESDAENKIEVHNSVTLEEAAERIARDNFGGEKQTKQANDYLKFIEEYKENNQLVLVDPIDVKKKIQSLKDEVDAFMSGVDSAIQIANATTEIEINY